MYDIENKVSFGINLTCKTMNGQTKKDQSLHLRLTIMKHVYFNQQHMSSLQWCCAIVFTLPYIMIIK